MKTYALIIVVFFLVTGVSAQDSVAGKVALSLSKKEQRKAKADAEFQQTVSLLSSRQFVLEADWLGNSSGTRVPVMSNLNFISVDSTETVVQTGNNAFFSRNGFGGITAEGIITDWKEITNTKSRSCSVRLDISTRRGLYTVFIDISASGNATATLSGLTMGRLIYYGRLVPLNESHAYSGMSL